jgi:hypothetical protein
MIYSWLRRKVKWLIEQVQTLQSAIENIDTGEYRQDFTISGSDPELQAEIIAYAESSYIQQITFVELSEYTSGQVIVMIEEWPQPGWPDITHVYIDSSNPENVGYFPIDSTSFEQPYLTIDISTWPGVPAEIMVMLCSETLTYKVQTAVDIPQNPGEMITIQESDNCNGTYMIINKENPEAEVYLITTSPGIGFPSMTNLGAIYSLPSVNDIVFNHNFETDFIEIKAYYYEVQNDDFVQQYCQKTNSNTVTLLSSQFGTEQIGQTGKIFIKKLD